MKVLHLPANLASQMRVTVLAQRETGLDVRGLTGPSPVQNAAGLEILPHAAPGASFLRRKTTALRRAVRIMEAIAWADIVHWHYSAALPCAADLRAAKLLGRKRFVEFWGSDIRNPEFERADNPHFARLWDSGDYECRDAESEENSLRVQRRFSDAGAHLLICSPGMAQYVAPGCFPHRHATSQRLLLEEYPPAIPRAANPRPLVVHAPSAPGAKGTKFILTAVEKLRSECDFDFQLIHGMTPLEAREWMSRCDIYVDQLITGEYGVASVEAMALGKPVICYIKPSLRPHYPAHFPVISANPETVEEVLRDLLRDGPRRQALGENSRSWAEERHDARKVVAKIAEYYHAA